MSASTFYTNLITATATNTELILDCKLVTGRGKPATVATVIMPHEVAGKLGLVLAQLTHEGENDENRNNEPKPPVDAQEPERSKPRRNTKRA